MSDRLLPYYRSELDALRGLAGEFAASNPKIAGRLRLGADMASDPHVERLLEGVAFLCARAQQRLDDELPEISDALLGVLYPHYLQPVPSAAIAQFVPKPDLRAPVRVPAGTMLDTDPVAGGEPCRFRTAYDTTLWPVEVEQIRLTGLPLAAPASPWGAAARSSLRIALKLAGQEVDFPELGMASLRFFLRAPPAQSLPFYEALCGHVLGVALARGPNDDRPTLLPAHHLQPAGFTPEQALYPWSARSPSAYRLLTEYFALPEKFLFVDLNGIDARTLTHEGDRLEVFVYLDRAWPELERLLPSDGLALGCTPVVNLFPRQCEPIRLDHLRTEYPVVPDRTRQESLEVWSVEAVHEMGDDGSLRPWRPFYRHPADNDSDGAGHYLTVRRDTEVLLAPFDPALPADAPVGGQVLSVNTLCTNGDLPSRLPFGGGQPALRVADGNSAVRCVRCLTAPTPSWRMKSREQRSWRLISLLSLGHLSIVGSGQAASALHEVLCLHDWRETDETRAAIVSLAAVSSHPATARVPGARQGSFCRGLDVVLAFDPAGWEAAGGFLLASVLEHVMALHATVNAFVRTVAVLHGRPGWVARFPPRAGARVLL